MNLVGRVIGNRYEIIEKIGEGGMATVYKAKCNILKRYVAVKVLRDEFTTDEEFIKRFNTEAQSAASLTHPNIVSIYDVGHEENIYYIVMELVQGKTLKDIINEDGTLPWKWALNVSIQVASALEMAHRNSIVHRDIKPHNIIITEDGIAKVTDFGIAKAVSNSTITAFGTTIGSVHYFSPEHARGGYTDAKSDLYSLGVVMYEMLTGRVPFDADTPVSIALKHMQEKPIEPIKLNPTIPYAVNKIIMKAMEKDPNERYQSATEMLKDLSMALKNPEGDFVEQKDFTNQYTQRIPTLGEQEYIRNNDEDYEDEEQDEPKKKMSKKKKAIIITVIILGIILLPVIGFFGMKTIMDWGVPKDVDLPNLVGKTLEEANKEIEKTDIKLEKTEEFNADVEAGKIISQEPPYIDGYTVKENSTIKIVISKGTEKAIVENVKGKTYEEAAQILDNVNLKVERIDQTSKTVEAGIVIDQDPAGDKEVNAGDTVKLYVSSGTGIKQVEVESVIGKSEEAANSILTKAGLKVNIGYKEDSSKPTDTVLSQDPAPGEKVDEGTTVTIVVNNYKKPQTATIYVNVKDLVPKSLQGSETTNTTEGETAKEVKVQLTVGEGAAQTTTTSADTPSLKIDIQGTGQVEIALKISSSTDNEIYTRSIIFDFDTQTSYTFKKG